MAKRVKSVSFSSVRSDPAQLKQRMDFLGRIFVWPRRGWSLPVLEEDVLRWDVWLSQAPPSWLPALQGADFGASRLEHDGQGGQQQHEEAQDKKDRWGSREGGRARNEKHKKTHSAPFLFISLLFLPLLAGAGG